MPPRSDALSNLSTQAGARIGMLRTMVRTSLQASTDGLTGLMNRRTFQSRMRAMRRSGVSFSMVMADIDHFKRLNDTHGHETGDRALKTFCEVAASTLRSTDLFARWGGEEFAFALVGLSAEDAAEVLDRVRLELAAKLSTSDLPGFTVSYGIVDADHCATLDDAVRRPTTRCTRRRAPAATGVGRLVGAPRRSRTRTTTTATAPDRPPASSALARRRPPRLTPSAELRPRGNRFRVVSAKRISDAELSVGCRAAWRTVRRARVM